MIVSVLFAGCCLHEYSYPSIQFNIIQMDGMSWSVPTTIGASCFYVRKTAKPFSKSIKHCTKCIITRGSMFLILLSCCDLRLPAPIPGRFPDESRLDYARPWDTSASVTSKSGPLAPSSRWVSIRGPLLGRADAGSITVPQSSVTCPAPI